MEDFDGAEDLDDDWFYESVTRYNTLQMFYLQNIPQKVIQLDDSRLCIASRNEKCKNTELLELRLPVKLTLPAEDEGRSKENDFKMLSGVYINNTIYQMVALRNEKKVVTSQIGNNGMQIYCFQNDNESGTNKEAEIFTTKVGECPNISINESKNLIISSKCDHRPVLMCDISRNEIVSEIKYPFNTKLESQEDTCSVNNINCQTLNENMLAVLNSNTGVITLIDLRTENIISQLDRCSSKNELWVLSECDYNASSYYFGTLSDRGNLCLYDMRNNNFCTKHECFSSLVNNLNILKLKLTNRDRFSISGVDSNIYVYSVLKNSCELVFTHNGHCQKAESFDIGNIVNDHIWLPNIGDNFVLSVCNNRSLNCWEYNEATS